MLGWLRKLRRDEVLAQPVPEAWLTTIERWVLYDELDPGERARLLDIVKVLMAEKNWEGCGGLELTEPMCAVIAAQIALLILEIPHDHFAESESVLVYPSDYVVPGGVHVGDGVYTTESVRSGEAWHRGPVVLSWARVHDDVEDEHASTNLVLHEFAHRLDMLSGVHNGTPPLEGRVDPQRWSDVMQASFDSLKAADEANRDTLIDPYGATNEVEFFAVATECFFIDGPELRAEDPDLYGVLSDYYCQDPAARFREAD